MREQSHAALSPDSSTALFCCWPDVPWLAREPTQLLRSSLQALKDVAFTSCPGRTVSCHLNSAGHLLPLYHKTYWIRQNAMYTELTSEPLNVRVIMRTARTTGGWEPAIATPRSG